MHEVKISADVLTEGTQRPRSCVRLGRIGDRRTDVDLQSRPRLS